MKLLQWNIWYKEDISNILKTIRAINPDIVCLQELTVNHSEYNKNIDTPRFIAEGLGFHYFYQGAQKIIDEQEMESGNGIFSRYSLLNQKFYYIQDPQDPSVENLDYSKEGRVYLETKLDVGSKQITVATTHMSYTDRFVPTKEKEREASKLIELLRKHKKNFIFTGDLNLLPESKTIREISGFLKNAGPEFTQNTWTTKPFSYNGFEAKDLDWRLDYCFATPDVEVKSVTIIDTSYSDHLPILLEF